ncbi:MAG: hypothetical protein IT548_14605 [Alphaproteobacteria bacterium]|nr:hypothetical protein [Alphaproteobacteria bacterium]
MPYPETQSETSGPDAEILAARHTGAAVMFGHAPACEFVGSVRGLFWRALARAAAQTNLHLAQPTSRSYDVERGPDHRSIQYTRVVAQLSLALQRISAPEVTDNPDDLLRPSFMDEIDGFLAHVAYKQPVPHGQAAPAAVSRPAAAAAKAPSARPLLQRPLADRPPPGIAKPPPLPPPPSPAAGAPQEQDEKYWEELMKMFEFDDPDPDDKKPLSKAKQQAILAAYDRSKNPDDPNAWSPATRRHFGYALPTDVHCDEPGMSKAPFDTGLSVFTDRDLLKNFETRKEIAAERAAAARKERPRAGRRSPDEWGRGVQDKVSHKIEDRRPDGPPRGPRISTP